jgi:deazaflavin-dependent oxidoreductase (nitroreductase family)
MTTNHAEAATASTAFVTIGPSRLVRMTVGPMTKILNPVIRRMAGRPHFRMAALIRHVGRRSGRRYETPAGARLSGDTFVIPLTFGSESDWSRNVRAADGCSIRLNGVDYEATAPEVVSATEAGPVARSAFGPLVRASFRLLGIRQFLLLRLAGCESE